METNLAVIENGIVTNIIVVDPTDTVTISHFGGLVLPSGSPVSIGYTWDGSNFAPPPLPFSEVQSAQLALMDTSYNAANTQPIPYMGTTFQADKDSQDLIASVITACGGSLPDGFVWYDSNNLPQPMSFAQLQGLAATILMRGQPLFYQKQARKAAIRAATSAQQVEAITW